MASDYQGFTLTMTRRDKHLFNFQVQLDGINQDTRLWDKFWFTAKRSTSDADVAAVMQLTSLTDGGIEALDDTVGLYRVTINSPDTEILDNTYSRLFCDIQGKDDQGKIWTLVKGILIVLPETTLAIS